MDIILLKVFLAAFLADSIFANNVQYEGAQVLRIQPRNSRHIQILDELINRYPPERDDSETISFWKRSRLLDEKSDVLVTKKHLESVKNALMDADVPVEILIDNVAAKITLEQQQHNIKRNIKQEDFYSNYHSYEDIQNRLEYLKGKYPNLLETEVIGLTEEKRKLTIAKVSSGKSVYKKVAYLEGGAHSREWVGPAVTMFTLERLLESPEILEKMDFYMLPLLNPDGYEFSRNSDRMWRKNRSVNSESPCRGTDLNRNFDFEWMHSDSSPYPCSETYAGSSGASENEVKAVQTFLKGLDKLNLFISLHSYGQYWFHPWAYKNNDPPNSEKMMKIGEAAVLKIKEERNIEYRYGRPGSFLYDASGSSMDWICNEISKKNPEMLSYTVELRDTGSEGFFLSAEHIVATSEDLWTGLRCIHHQITTGNEVCNY